MTRVFTIMNHGTSLIEKITILPDYERAAILQELSVGAEELEEAVHEADEVAVECGVADGDVDRRRRRRTRSGGRTRGNLR